MNLDRAVVAGFGDEWTRFDQSTMPEVDLLNVFDKYFAVFPWDELPEHSIGADVGCGSGRWARLVAPRVGQLHVVDASEEALSVAMRNLADSKNCEFHLASVDELPFADESLDFLYTLGVLHHVPDTPAAIRACVRALKPGAPLLLYLYYHFDNRPGWFRGLWRIADGSRRLVSRLPLPVRYGVSQILAAVIYFPLARASAAATRLGIDTDNFPLSFYKDKSFYVMRTDALDRFGTRLEQRFTRAEIERMLLGAGLERVEFSEREPYWCAVARRPSRIDSAR